MFSGIVEETGRIDALEAEDGPVGGTTLTIHGPRVLEGTGLGDSIAVNGVCLTVISRTDDQFTVGLAPETLRKTNLGTLSPGDSVNLERALRVDGRFDGHMVQGHVETTARIRERIVDGDSLRMHFDIDPAFGRYIVPKGYVAVDGISLTVVDAAESEFSIMLIAWTRDHVTLSRKTIGNVVNIETDIVGRYVEHFMRL
ncbi:MAG: riboflavin synthase [Bacteroidetes bacterium CG12_big_fil_rev_8_21_14_0_65_60_17]|nr:MAG: riboflavin synthase [Bacteroidetes bacterium CG12_big_fil_rev_8_21_14_0_65_60_17]